MIPKIKSQRPTDTDIHLKYICDQCDAVHWLSFQEASTPNFKVVCDNCGNTFKVKTITEFKLRYKKNKQSKEELSSTILDKCVETLVGFGFAKTEASELINLTYKKHKTTNIVSLIKLTLESLKNNHGN